MSDSDVLRIAFFRHPLLKSHGCFRKVLFCGYPKLMRREQHHGSMTHGLVSAATTPMQQPGTLVTLCQLASSQTGDTSGAILLEVLELPRAFPWKCSHRPWFSTYLPWARNMRTRFYARSLVRISFHPKQPTSRPKYGNRFKNSNWFDSSYRAANSQTIPVKYGRRTWTFFIHLPLPNPFMMR